MNDDYYGVIMAGGIGSRFWPMSTSKNPKQFHDILGIGRTFIQQTFDRLNQFISTENIYVVTTESYANLTKEQLPELTDSQIVIEPVGKNTAPCNLYVALKIQLKNPNASMIVAPSDHLILNENRFAEIALSALQKASKENVLITMGIEPTRPDTGYGYIQFIENEETEFKEVKTFTEKPNAEWAQKFIDSGDFLWNAGIFVWSAKSILTSFQHHLPDMYQSLKNIENQFNTELESSIMSEVYPTLQSISVDNGIMEKADNVYVIPSSFGWSDLGTWGSLYENLEKDENGNIIHAEQSLVYNTTNCIVKTNQDKAIVVDGLENYIVVDTKDALLICPKAKDQEVKKVVNDLKLEKYDNFV